jgi:hypothetical protein
MDLAACEVLAERELIVVYAVRTRRGSLAGVFGPQLDREVRRRYGRRFRHGRTSEIAALWFSEGGGGRG